MMSPLFWTEDGLGILDQRLLPRKERYVIASTIDAVRNAIVSMQVRGAPAIGIAGAYGLVLAARTCGVRSWRGELEYACRKMEAARPTAVNLSWAMSAVRDCLVGVSDLEQARRALLTLAISIHERDRVQCDAMSDYGASWIEANSPARPLRIMTHCNTGSLATGGIGTAVGVIRRLGERSRLRKVVVTETRPWLQGSRLTAWELQKLNLPVELIVDSAAAYTMAKGLDWLVVGADRITANGDVANKIGTLQLAILARHYKVKCMVVAPTTSFDFGLASGRLIAVEQRSAGEVARMAGEKIAPDNVPVANPVFDVTPDWLIDAIVTERGVFSQPYRQSLLACLAPQSPKG